MVLVGINDRWVEMEIDTGAAVSLVAERISNHYLVWELFWPLEFRIYISRPMRMVDMIPFCPGPFPGQHKSCANHSHPLFASSLASSRTDQPM